MNTAHLSSCIDLAFLKVDGESSVERLRETVAQVQKLGLRSICVPPVLAGTVKKNFPDINVSAVVAYPLGAETLAAKVFCCGELIEQKVDELDVVLDLFALVNDNRRKIEIEARELVAAIKPHGVLLKAIIETPILSDEQIRWATEVLCAAGAACIKTSTGYGREPARAEHVGMIKEVASGRALIKASGGIKTHAEALAMVEAGADIIGTSDAVALLQLPTAN